MSMCLLFILEFFYGSEVMNYEEIFLQMKLPKSESMKLEDSSYKYECVFPIVKPYKQ